MKRPHFWIKILVYFWMVQWALRNAITFNAVFLENNFAFMSVEKFLENFNVCMHLIQRGIFAGWVFMEARNEKENPVIWGAFSCFAELYGVIIFYIFMLNRARAENRGLALGLGVERKPETESENRI